MKLPNGVGKLPMVTEHPVCKELRETQSQHVNKDERMLVRSTGYGAWKVKREKRDVDRKRIIREEKES